MSMSACSPFGIKTPKTLSFPSASQQRAATIVESFPPEIPITAGDCGPFLSNHSFIHVIKLSVIFFISMIYILRLGSKKSNRKSGGISLRFFLYNFDYTSSMTAVSAASPRRVPTRVIRVYPPLRSAYLGASSSKTFLATLSRVMNESA